VSTVLIATEAPYWT